MTLFLDQVLGGRSGKKVALVLSDLEDAEKVERALKVAIERQLTEAQAKSLVSWMRKEHDPESFGEKVAKDPTQDPNDPHAALWPTLPKTLKMRKTPQGYQMTWTLTEAEAPVAAYGSMAWLEHMKQKAGVAKEDPHYRQALPSLLDNCAKAYEKETADKTAQAEAIQKAQAAKAEAKAQKAAAQTLRAQSAESKAQARVQKEAEKRDAFENCKLDTKNHLEATFGTNPFTEALYQKSVTDQRTPVLKAVKVSLHVLGKSPEEQAAYIQDLKSRLSRMARLNPQKPASGTRPSTPKAQDSKPAATVPTPAIPETPAEAASLPHSPGLLDRVKGAVEKVTESVDSGSLLGTVVNMALKNAKQTVNYEERKGMRHILNDIL